MDYSDRLFKRCSIQDQKGRALKYHFIGLFVLAVILTSYIPFSA
jgi:heme/copper-type cytochrome/quinol oxidase subunit 4